MAMEMTESKSMKPMKSDECLKSLVALASLSTLPSDIIREVHKCSNAVRGQFMYQVQVDRPKVIGDGLSYADFSFENDLFVIYCLDIKAFSIYRGGIFHKNVPVPQKPRSILVRDGFILVRHRSQFEIVGLDWKIAVYSSDGCFVHEYTIHQPDPSVRFGVYRVCPFASNHDGGVKQFTNTNTSQLLSVTWVKKNVNICQCYDSQSNLSSSFEDENYGKYFALPIWIERNATFITWKDDVLTTYDRFGTLVSATHTDITPISESIENFSMIGGECHKFEFQRNHHNNQQYELKISNQCDSWCIQIHPFIPSLSLTTGNCAKATENGNVVTFDCFY